MTKPKWFGISAVFGSSRSLAASRAPATKALPNVDGLSTDNYPRFADIAELESAFYGAAA